MMTFQREDFALASEAGTSSHLLAPESRQAYKHLELCTTIIQKRTRCELRDPSDACCCA